MGIRLDISDGDNLMSSSLEHRTAMLIDTNNYQRKMLRTLLRSSGFHRVNEVECFETGLVEAKRSYPDFVFADFDTAKRSDLMRGKKNIRREFLGLGTHLIFLLHNATRFRVDSAIASGANWVVSRPFSPKCLDRRIRAVLDPGSLIQIDSKKEMLKIGRMLSLGQESDNSEMTEMLSQMDSLLKKSKYFQNLDNDKQDNNASDSTNSEEDIFLL